MTITHTNSTVLHRIKELVFFAVLLFIALSLSKNAAAQWYGAGGGGIYGPNPYGPSSGVNIVIKEILPYRYTVNWKMATDSRPLANYYSYYLQESFNGSPFVNVAFISPGQTSVEFFDKKIGFYDYKLVWSVQGYLGNTFHHESEVVSMDTFPLGHALYFNDFEKHVSNKAAEKLSLDFDKYHISLSSGDLLVRMEPLIEPQRIDTGHSCTHKAWIRSNYIEVKILSSTSIDFKGNSLTEPLITFLDLPVSVYAKVSLKEEWGYRIFGSCNSYASDSYSADALAFINALTRVFISLEPTIRPLSNGDFEVMIEPVVNVTIDFDDIDLDFDFHGKSILNGVATKLTSISSTLKAIEAGLDGESMEEDLRQSLFDVGLGLFQTIEWISGSIDLVDDLLDDIAKAEAERYLTELGFENELENNIYASLSDALKLDENGRRSFVIRTSELTDWID